MRGGLRIGRVRGIDLVVDWSWSLVFLMMSWNLTVVFRRWHASWSLGVDIVLAVVATLLFFASLVAHELAHSIVAQRFGMTVREIRIFLFGGVANIEREPPTAAAELWMAIVGPLTSIGLGALFIVAAGGLIPSVEATNPLETLGGLGPLATLLFWLGPVNVVVGVFNLLPAFPLDGGRIFRAVLWWVMGDLRKATTIAANLGRSIGWVFIVAGIASIFGAHLPFFGGGAANGLWMTFIGWFLKESAFDSAGAQRVHDALTGLRVEDLMRRSGAAVPSDATIRGLADGWFLHTGERAFPVVDGADLVGLVSLPDLQKVPRERWDTARVTEIMTARDALVTVAPTTDASTALRPLLDRSIHQLPVVDERDGFVGMVFGGDIMRWVELRGRATMKPAMAA